MHTKDVLLGNCFLYDYFLILQGVSFFIGGARICASYTRSIWYFDQTNPLNDIILEHVWEVPEFLSGGGGVFQDALFQCGERGGRFSTSGQGGNSLNQSVGGQEYFRPSKTSATRASDVNSWISLYIYTVPTKNPNVLVVLIKQESHVSLSHYIINNTQTFEFFVGTCK